ncbi:hypothetical protein ILUMI_15031, partial [Ignelater luminosus]
WFGHAEKIQETREAKLVYLAGMEERRRRGRPRRVWIDDIRDGLRASNISLPE